MNLNKDQYIYLVYYDSVDFNDYARAIKAFKKERNARKFIESLDEGEFNYTKIVYYEDIEFDENLIWVSYEPDYSREPFASNSLELVSAKSSEDVFFIKPIELAKNNIIREFFDFLLDLI